MRHDEILGLLPRLQYGRGTSIGLWLFLLELLFWTIVALATIVLIRFRPILFQRAEDYLRRISHHKRFWLAAFPLGVIVVRLALLVWIPIPVPTVHDEFSYLLASDTFAHGRLTNPSNPMWVHFESFHINLRPTYQSMYPPAQGLALALGQKLTGVPWFGVLLSVALMCGAIYWMLLGWLPPSWAWLGAAFACARFGVFSYWVNSYWGGAVAAIGGALVLGALPRLRRDLRMSTTLIAAAGLFILANSRPMEGFLFSLPILVSAAVTIVKKARLDWRGTARAVLPAVALLALGATWMLYYNWRGTGNPLVMPYAVNFGTYHITRPFFFQKPNPVPNYRHFEMRLFYVYYEMTPSLLWHNEAASLTRIKAGLYYGFFIWPFLLILGPSLYALWRSELRVILFSAALLALDLFAQVWPSFPHYAAPATGALLLTLLYGVRHFRESGSEYALWGSRAAAIVFAVWLISPMAEAVRNPFEVPIVSQPNQQATGLPLQIQRERIQAQVEQTRGKHLVIVHYPPGDIPSQEWVYNKADIGGSRVIWARDMGYLSNEELLSDYADRQAWYVDRGDPLFLLVPYDQATAALKLAFEWPESKANSERSSLEQQQLPEVRSVADRHPAAIPLSLSQ